MLKTLFVLAALMQPVFSHAGLFDSLKSAIDSALDVSQIRLKIYKSAEDKQLVDAFYFISEDGKQQSVAKELLALRDAYRFEKLGPEVLTLSNLFYKDGFEEVVYSMSVYAESPLDAFGKRYVAFANGRGNQVRQYKPELTGIINSMLVQNMRYMPGPNVRTWLAKDNALIEVNPKGELVSVMTRSHRAINMLIATSDMYVNIYMGKNLMRLLENSINNRVFDDNFQRVVILDSTEQVASEVRLTPEVAIGTQQNAASPTPAPVPVAAPTPLATTAPVAPIPQTAPVAGLPKQPMSLEKKMQLLQELAELKKAGTLTAEEFSREKAKFLAQ